MARAPKKATPKKATKTPKKPPAKKAVKKVGIKSGEPKLLSGGNPQIAKGYGEAPVQAYIAAMPGWKSQIGRRLDALVTKNVPKVAKAVKWNSPLYGIEGDGWFLGIHCFDKYIKLAFFKGVQLNPAPPVASKQKDVRYFHIHNGDSLDEKQLATWIKAASKLPGEKM